jgi:hypothetical protein
MLLCEVALGKIKPYIQGPDQELESAPAGFNSVQGTPQKIARIMLYF